MKLLRTLSTSRLVLLIVAVVGLAAGGAAIAVAASGGSGSTPPPKPLAQALHDSLAGAAPQGVTARIKFTNKLFPSGAITGQVGSALMSGASGRLWATNDGRGRLELQSDAGDVQIVWNDTEVTIFDASSNTVYSRDLPAHNNASKGHEAKSTVPTIAKIGDFLTKVGKRANISAAEPTNVAGEPAYSVSVSPKHDGGLLGSLNIAWDAARGVPLRFAIYAQGASSPVLALEATDISYGPVSSANVDVSPPATAKKSTLGPAASGHKEQGAKERAQKSKHETPRASGVSTVEKAVHYEEEGAHAQGHLPE